MPNRECSETECTNPAYCRGWCRAHYLRVWRYGSPEKASTRRPSTPNTCSIQGCGRTEHRLRRGWCPMHYHRWQRHGDPLVVKAAGNKAAGNKAAGNKGVLRSWRHVVITDTCWLWTGPCNQHGYGRNGGRLAHRVVYERLVGPIPAGLQLDHLCRTRNCVRPDRLEPVTSAENVRRAYAAARADVAA